MKLIINLNVKKKNNDECKSTTVKIHKKMEKKILKKTQVYSA